MSNNTCGAAGVITDTGGGFVTVRLSLLEECSSCGCGCRRGASSEISIKTSKDFKIGDQVILSLPSKKALKFSALFYGLPIVFMTVAAVVSAYVFNTSEIVSAVSTMVAIPIAWVLVKLVVKNKDYPEIDKKEI